MGEVIKPACGVGLGPDKEANDTRCFTLSFKAVDRSGVMDIVNKAIYPELCKTDISTLSKEYGDLIGFYFSTYEWDRPCLSLCNYIRLKSGDVV